MRLSEFVLASNVAESTRLMRVVAMQTAATDPRTGTLDMGMISSGHGGAGGWKDRDLVRRLADQLRTGQRLMVEQIRQILMREIWARVEVEMAEQWWRGGRWCRGAAGDSVVQLYPSTRTLFVARNNNLVVCLWS